MSTGVFKQEETLWCVFGTVTSGGYTTTVVQICRTLLCQPYPGEHQEQETLLCTAEKLSKGKRILLAILLEKSPHCVASGGGNCIRIVYPSLLQRSFSTDISSTRIICADKICNWDGSEMINQNPEKYPLQKSLGFAPKD